MRNGLIAFCVLFIACNGANDTIPLPRAYPRIILPEGTEAKVNLDYCPFVFEKNSYAEIEKDNYIFNEKAEHDCWFDLNYSDLNSTIHCSYLPVNNNKDLDKYIQDAYKLANKHVKKANYIEEIVFKSGEKTSGMLFLMEGPTATPAQFFLTDSIDHFFRGSLYINAPVDRDSTRPIVNFLMDDLRLLMETLQWEEQ